MTQREEAEAALLEAALEERLGATAPPDLTDTILRARRGPGNPRHQGRTTAPAGDAAAARTRRTPLFAAVVLLGGIAVVGGVAIATRGPGSNPALSPPQDPKPEPKPEAKPQPLAGTMDAAAHFPLALGNRWEYREVCGDLSCDVTVVVTARVPMKDTVIAQVTTIGSMLPEPDFTFWSADARGVHLHGSDSIMIDPRFSPCEVEGLVLPSPIGAEAEWAWSMLPPPPPLPGGAAGPRRRTPDAIKCTATLLGVGEKLVVGDQTFSCVHVRVDGMWLPHPPRVEHLYFARGIGIVRRTFQTRDEPELCRELVRFVPAMPPPDRDTLLAASIGDASKTCTWLELPVTDDAAWTLRSQFAIEPRPEGVRCFRLFGDRIVPFDPTSLADFEALARDEDFAPRMHSLFPQRMTVGLARLVARLRAVRWGQRFERDNGMSVEVSHNSSKVTLPVVFKAPDGSETKHEIVVRTSKAIPTAVLFDGR